MSCSLPQGLFRKVVLADISAHDLVRMTTEKLASDELAQWREKTIKKVRIGANFECLSEEFGTRECVSNSIDNRAIDP